MWRQANYYGIPRIAFMNKMDRNNVKLVFAISNVISLTYDSHVSFANAVESIRSKLHTVPLPIQVLFKE